MVHDPATAQGRGKTLERQEETRIEAAPATARTEDRKSMLWAIGGAGNRAALVSAEE